MTAGHDRFSHDPLVADMMDCVDLGQQLECGRRKRFLEHQSKQLEYDQLNPYLNVHMNGDSSVVSQVQRQTQDPDPGKHYTLFPEAADLLNQSQREQGDQYSCITHEMVDVTGQAYKSLKDGLCLWSGRDGASVSTGSTRLSLHPAAAAASTTASNRGGASIISLQHKKVDADEDIVKDIADDLTLTLCTSVRHTHTPESSRVV